MTSALVLTSKVRAAAETAVFKKIIFGETPMGTGSVPKSERCQQLLVPRECLYFRTSVRQTHISQALRSVGSRTTRIGPLGAVAQVLRINGGILCGAVLMQDNVATDPPPGGKG